MSAVILSGIKKEWDAYVKYLKEKYPAEIGEEWDFTCPYHKKINAIINDMDIDSIHEAEDADFDRLQFLDALEAAGVDNWEGYSEALGIQKEWND